MKATVLTFKPDGMVVGIYTEAIPLAAIGTLKINRLTEIEFNDSTQEWEARDRIGRSCSQTHPGRSAWIGNTGNSTGETSTR